MTNKDTFETPSFGMTRAELEQLGRGQLAYVRPIKSDEAKSLTGGKLELPEGEIELFCLFMADGTPVSISSTREAAVANAMVNDLTPVPLN